MRLGTVGTGTICEAFICAMNAAAGVWPAAIYSRSWEKGMGISSRFGHGYVYTDRGEFLSADFDCLYVASPNSLHYSWCRDALLSGKHVICEKPLCSNAREARELYALAKERGLFLFEANMIPYMPIFPEIKNALTEIGEVRSARLDYSQRSSKLDEYLSGGMPNVFSAEFSGGALMDLGCYNVSLLTLILGKADTLSYQAELGRGGADMSGTLTLTYPRANAVSTQSKTAGADNIIEFTGTLGRIVCRGPGNNIRSVTVITGSGERIIYPPHGESATERMTSECAFFEKAIKTGEVPAFERAFGHSLAVLEQLDMVRASAGIVFPADVTAS